MGAAGQQHLAGAQAAAVQAQGDALRHAVAVEHALAMEGDAQRLGRPRQFDDHAVRVDEVPGGREEQPAANPVTELGRRRVQRLRSPERHRHALPRHARLEGLQRRAGGVLLVHQQRTVLAQQVGPLDGLQQAAPGAQAGFVDGPQAGHGAGEGRRPQVEQQAQEPGGGAWQVGPVQAQRAHGVEEHARQALEDRQVGDREHLLGGQVPGIAEGGALPHAVRVEHLHPQPLARELQGAGDTDDAGADHRDIHVRWLEIAHVQASRSPSSSRRSPRGLASRSAAGSKASGKPW